ATAQMIDALSAGTDARLVALGEQAEALEREREAARLEAGQSSSAERRGRGHPMREIAVVLVGTGAIEGLELAYTVPAARWWPVYTLRISDKGRSEERRVGEEWRCRWRRCG